MTGSIRSGGNVLDTATSVTDATSRPASSQARAMSARTCSKPVVDGATAMRWLYRNARCTATSNKRTRPLLVRIFAGDLGQRGAVDHLEHTVFPADGVRRKKPLERLVGMHQRHAERISEMLLRKRELDRAVFGQARFLGTHEQMQQEIGGAFQRGAPAEAAEIFVDQLLLASRQPGDVEGKRRKAIVQIPQLGARKHAQHQRRERLDRVLHLAHQRALQADHVGWQGVIENLPAAVVQHLVTECPAAEHRIKMLAAGALAQEACTGVDAQFVGFELLYERQLLGRKFTQSLAPPQRALFAWRDMAVRPPVS